MRTTRFLAAAAVSALAVGTLSAVPSAADPSARPSGKDVLARHLVGPLSVAVENRDVYVTQNFAGVLNKLRPGRSPKTVYASPNGHEVGGVSVRHGRVVFTETASSGEENPTNSWLRVVRKSGKAKRFAHIWAYEEAHNPDGGVTYGVRGISDDCAAQWPAEQFGPAVYSGIVDSHPYATFQTKRRVYVADAGMNAVLSVSRSGRIRTVATTPPVPVMITADLAAQLGAPDCVVGLTYYGESVPTDVEMGRGGKLYVTTLGGGLGEMLPLGAVFRMNPMTGHRAMVLDELSTPTDLAITRHGAMLIAELFANRIVRVRHGSTHVRTWTPAKLPAAVDIERGRVYATVNALPPEGGAPNGKVVRYRR